MVAVNGIGSDAGFDLGGERVAYYSAHSFSQAFKRRFGISPGACGRVNTTSG